MEDLDREDARCVIDPALKMKLDAAHRYEGYVAQSRFLDTVPAGPTWRLDQKILMRTDRLFAGLDFPQQKDERHQE